MSQDSNPYSGTPQILRSSTCAFIQDIHGNVLLQRRSDNGYWNLPGGRLELNESVAEGCVREVREETGLETKIQRLIGIYSAPQISTMRYTDETIVQYVTSLFECRIIGGKLQHDHESLELGWFDPEKLPRPFSPNHILRLRDALERRQEAFWR